MFATRHLASLTRSMSTLSRVHTAKAPAAIGPYAQAIKTNGMVYTSGQIPVVPETGNVVEGGITEQTRQSLTNLSEVLKEAGSDLNKVVKTTVFLKDMNDFVAMNEVYASFFSEHQPARSAVQVARLPKDVAVEIECVALTD
ncbi:endoribonuclease L-PSP [Radiomyces spectabilis]|uniref:endoribonuclease L-PSP n=1 Tax=Radiomyces spectabilis TaxID=64574 RepID=UPI002220EF1F|nr:endoribonuclease L-PSP [Radiomyces spectabilis]KAI8391577.1 endoribonuclease L-PSP [Radiomyces spectabilis]